MRKILLSIIPIIIFIALSYALYTYKQYSNFYNNLTPLVTASSTVPVTTSLSLDEVSKHANKTSCYTIINSNVYDLTTWIDKHPGGPQRILSICGKDGSSNFEQKHGEDSRAKTILAGFQVGILAK
jgi:cytochrome b involved in lipid metabolism